MHDKHSVPTCAAGTQPAFNEYLNHLELSTHIFPSLIVLVLQQPDISNLLFPFTLDFLLPLCLHLRESRKLEECSVTSEWMRSNVSTYAKPAKRLTSR